MLAGPSGHENIVVRGARLLDPLERVDAVLDVRIDGGVITQIGEGLDTNEHRVVEAAGKTLVPAFVDPHVHLRTPGREDEETIESGTAAAAAGGYCAILAMPNTEPIVDDPELIRGLRARAEAEAQVPVGFFAAITKGQAGEELAELGPWRMRARSGSRTTAARSRLPPSCAERCSTTRSPAAQSRSIAKSRR